MEAFSQLGLSEEITRAIEEMAFSTPTEIQQKAIPILIDGSSDFIGLAQTGTGKTAAFGLPLLDRLDPKQKFTQALVLAPTRELCMQIGEQVESFAKYKARIKVATVYGGTSIVPQMQDLRKNPPQLLIATPGRLIDLVKRKAVKIDGLKTLVLDEADEMLNMGFKDELDTILEFTPEEKRTWLFSATMPKEIKRITNEYMQDPQEVTISPKKIVNENIEHQFALINDRDRMHALRRFIDAAPDMYAIVFCRTRLGTQGLAEKLAERGYQVDALHGDMSQQQRTMVMKRFKAKHLRLLIATDVAARGIDVNDLTHVFHYFLPDDNEYYTHRSGRTARAGKKGVSLSLITNKERYKLRMVEKSLNIGFTKVEVPSTEMVVGNKVDDWAKGLLNAEISETATPELLERVRTILGEVDAYDLIHKLLSAELEKLGYGKGNRDLNAAENSRGKERNDRQRDRGERRGKERDSGKYHRFFINLGFKDDLEKGDLLRFICDNSGLAGTDIGEIRLFRLHSTFDVDKSKSNLVMPAFDGAFANDRPLRVNRDDDNGSSSRGNSRGGRDNNRRSSFKGKKSGGGDFKKGKYGKDRSSSSKRSKRW